MSGNRANLDPAWLSQMGADDALAKPFTSEDFLGKIHRLANKARR